MKEFKKVCSNPWCKATFRYREKDLIKTKNGLTPPRTCKKCESFDKELSGGVKWETKNYEGNPWEGAVESNYTITNYRL